MGDVPVLDLLEDVDHVGGIVDILDLSVVHVGVQIPCRDVDCINTREIKGVIELLDVHIT